MVGRNVAGRDRGNTGIRRPVASHAIAARRRQSLRAPGDTLLERWRDGLFGPGLGEETVGETLFSC